MYECATGKPPFKASNFIELLQVIKKTVNKIPYPADMPNDLKDLLGKLLQTQPDLRISYEDFFSHDFFYLKECLRVERDL